MQCFLHRLLLLPRKPIPLTVKLKDIEIMKAGGGIDRRSHMVDLYAWTFYLLTFA